MVIYHYILQHEGTAVAQWLRCCATNRKVAGSITDEVIRIFYLHNPPDRTMALGSTQPLTEMSTRRISWGKGVRCVGLTTLPPFCAVVMKSGNLNFLEPSGQLQACNGTALPLLGKRTKQNVRYLLDFSCFGFKVCHFFICRWVDIRKGNDGTSKCIVRDTHAVS